MRYTGRAHWSPAPLRWRTAVVCPTPAPQLVFPKDVRAVTEHTARLQRLAQELPEQGKTWRLAPVVEALQALRGVRFTGAVPTVAELGDHTRVPNPTPLMSSLGLRPAAYASGQRRSQGGSPKTGHRHARRALVEGAWADRSPAKVSRHLQRRLDKRPPPLQDLSWQAQVRRCKRYRQLRARSKHANQVVVALARALVALMGAMARELPRAASTRPGARSLTERESRLDTSIGRGAAPVWYHPRWREAAASNPPA
jgi:transposase